MLRVVIVDDSPHWLERESQLLLARAEEWHLELSLTAYPSHTELFEQQRIAPDVLFSDIELGDGDSGIDLVRAVNELWPGCQVVYVTNHLRYAPEVYGTEHVWFVLKDQFEWRLSEVLKKLLSHVDERNATIVLKTMEHDLATIPCLELSYLERSGRVTNVHAADGTVYQVSDRISELIQRLPAGSGARCHGSFAVSFAHVRKIKSDAVLTVEGWEVPLSRRFSRSFRNAYLEWVDEHVV